MKKLYFLLSLVMAALTAGATTVTDVLTTANFVEGTTSSYASLGTYTAPSGNTYEAVARVYDKNGLCFTLSSNSASGIVATNVKGGVIRKVTVDLGDTSADRSLCIYGSHTPFTVNEMVSGINCEMIEAITKQDGTTEYTREFSTSGYEYVGVCSYQGIIYLKSITFEYDMEAAANPIIRYTIGKGGTATIVKMTGGGLTPIIFGGTDTTGSAELTTDCSISYSVTASEGYVIDQVIFNGAVVEEATGKKAYDQISNPIAVTGNIDISVTFIADAGAVEAIEAAEAVDPVYYNLQGVRVANPAEGVYIRVAGDKAEKVYLRK